MKLSEGVEAMKKFLLAGVVIISASTAAMAADLAAPLPEAYDWTGFYLGLNAGAAWNNSDVDIDDGVNPPFSLDDDGAVFTGGVEAGYNWQMDSFVMGVEADFNYLGFHEDQAFAVPVASIDLKENWFGTVRGRLGFAADNLLFYGTGGLAYGNAKAEVCFGAVCDSESNVNWGWTVGGGMQYAFDQSWILGAEYLYVDLGSPEVSCGAACNGDADAAFSVVRAKLDFKF
jgi:outer membrane immunogenic protein